MMKKVVFAISCILIVTSSCRKNDDDVEVEIPDFNFQQTLSFKTSLSAYGIFDGTPADLLPSEDFELLELSSALFTDYAHKQRLIKIPEGTSITKSGDGSLDFPDGTILTKTFFYFNDERDTSLGKRIIETRLEIKESGTWNIATYLWNESQTDATLKLDGQDTPVSWINSQGNNRSTLYHVPTQNECMTCHQSNSTMSPIGPTLLNLNRTVKRDSIELNQLTHLQSIGLMEQFSITDISQMVDYNDKNASLSDRGRAYLAINCAHCHNPQAWDVPAEKDFDFRHEIPFELTGIQTGKDKLSRNVLNQEMPFIGTTMMDEEGVDLLIEYLNSL
jgi:uncharacterized repeat protein (TIGR03806 family)